MKKLMVTMVVFMFVISGCASLGSNKSYDNYLDTVKAQVTAERKPLIDLTLDSDGRLSSLTMYEPQKHIRIEQVNPHPVWKFMGGAVRVIGSVGQIMAVGDAVTDIVEAGTGNSTNMNSFNDNSENAGHIQQDAGYQDTKTDMITTEVESTEAEEIEVTETE